MKPNIIIPKSILEQPTKISKNAFTTSSGKTNIGTIDIQDSAYILDQYYKDKNWQQYLDLFKKQADKVLYIPSGTVTIYAYMYANNFNLETIYIPPSVKYIQTGAFENCYALHTIIFLPSDENRDDNADELYIGDKVFQNCYGLYQFIFPSRLKEIGNNAFNNCYKLVELNICNNIYFTKNTEYVVEGVHLITPGSDTNGKVAYYLANTTNILATEEDNSLLEIDNITGQVYYTGDMRVYDNLKILGTASGEARTTAQYNGVNDTIIDYKEEHEGIFFIDDLSDTTTKNKFTQNNFQGEELYNNYVYDGSQTYQRVLYGMKFTSLNKNANYVFSAYIHRGLTSDITLHLIVIEKDKNGNLLNIIQKIPSDIEQNEYVNALNISTATHYTIKANFNGYFELTNFSKNNNNNKELWIFFTEIPSLDIENYDDYNNFISYATRFQIERGATRTAYEPHLTKQSFVLINKVSNNDAENSLYNLKYYQSTEATIDKSIYIANTESLNRNLNYKNQELKFLIHIPIDHLGRAIIKCPKRNSGTNLYLYNYLLYNNLKVEKLIIEEEGYNNSAEIILGHDAFANLLNVNEIHYNLYDAYVAMSEKYWDNDETEWMCSLFQNLGNSTIKGAIGYIDASKTKIIPPYLFNCRHRANSSDSNPFIIEYNLLPQNNKIDELNLIEAGAFGNNPRLRYLQLGTGFQFNNTLSSLIEQNIKPNTFVNCGRLYELRAIGLSKEETLTNFLNRLDNKDYGSIDNNLKKLYTSLEQQRDVYYKGNNGEFIYLYNSDKEYDDLIAYDGFIYNVNFPMDTTQKPYNIEHSTFNGLNHIRTLNFQNAPINRIGASAFRGLTHITTIELPNTLTFIDANCFRGDNKLQKVSGHCQIVYNKNNPHTNNIFDGCTSLKYFNWNNIYANPNDTNNYYNYIPQEQFYNTNLYNFIVPSHISILNRNCLKITSNGPQALMLFEHDETLPSLTQWENSNSPIQILRYEPSFQYDQGQWTETNTISPYCIWIKKHEDLTVGTDKYKNNWWDKLMQVSITQKNNGIDEIIGYQSYIRYYDSYSANDDGWVTEIHEVPGPHSVTTIQNGENIEYSFSNLAENLGTSRTWYLNTSTEAWTYTNDN